MLARIPADVSKRLIHPGCAPRPSSRLRAARSPRVRSSPARALDSSGSSPTASTTSGLGNAIAVDPDGNPVYSYLILPGRARRRRDPRRPAPSARRTSRPRPPRPPTAVPATSVPRSASAASVPTASSPGAPLRRSGTPPPASRFPTDRPPSTRWSARHGRTRTAPTSRSTTTGGKHVVWTGHRRRLLRAGGADVVHRRTGLRLRRTRSARPARSAVPTSRPMPTATLGRLHAERHRPEGRGRDRIRGRLDHRDGGAISPLCDGCPQPKGTQIGVTGGRPHGGVRRHARQNAVMVGRPCDGRSWTSSAVASDVQADGLVDGRRRRRQRAT